MLSEPWPDAQSMKPKYSKTSGLWSRSVMPALMHASTVSRFTKPDTSARNVLPARVLVGWAKASFRLCG
jgi:hypothetical protein